MRSKGSAPADAPKAKASDPLEASQIDRHLSYQAPRQSIYSWDLKSDAIIWDRGEHDAFDEDMFSLLQTGHALEELIAPEHVSRRKRLVEDLARTNSEQREDSQSFRLIYRLQIGSRGTAQSFWVEEFGNYSPESDDEPAKITGLLRICEKQSHDGNPRLEAVASADLIDAHDRDQLTGMLNRRTVLEAMSTTLDRATRTNTPFALFMVSINNLEVINKSYGFDVGDEVLATAAKRIGATLRNGDSIGRYASNKFVLLVNNCTCDVASFAGDRFIDQVCNTEIQTNRGLVPLTASIGAVVLPSQVNSVERAIDCSLRALDTAKRKRLSAFVMFGEDEMSETRRRRDVSVTEDVISALRNDRMKLVLQPIVRASTKEPAFYECLLRMEMANGEVVSAGDFVAIAENIGLSSAIDLRTLEMAVALLSKDPDLVLSLNISSLTAHDQGWLSTLKTLSTKNPGATQRLIVEITETVAIHDLDQTITFIEELKLLGCRVAIDDFGAGFSSFKSLKHLSLDMVKIDGAFVEDALADEGDRIVIKTLIDLARQFNIETVAEWVGDDATAEHLSSAGITYLQGFHYGKPVAAEDLAKTV